MKLVLKEIRETRINIKIITEKPLVMSHKCNSTLRKDNELMGSFIKSIDAAKKIALPKKLSLEP